MTEKIGPVQLLAIGFGPEAKFEGRIMDELSRLERQEMIRSPGPIRKRFWPIGPGLWGEERP